MMTQMLQLSALPAGQIGLAGGQILLISSDATTINAVFPVYNLTSVGSEIMALGEFSPDEAYIRLIAAHLAAHKVLAVVWHRGAVRPEGTPDQETLVERGASAEAS
jgi:hypothetical protein